MLKFNFKYSLLIKIIFFTFVIVFFCMVNQVSANSIKNIDIDVYIDNNGNAVVTEVWDVKLTNGTEGYRACKKIGNSEITNFSVTDQTGTIYQNISMWDTSADFESKAYKCGINTILNGIELCWGISNYGNNTYTLKYNISNFINQYTDTQGIYFNLLDLEQEVYNAKIVIHSDYNFSLDNARIWAFGNNGTINFKDGKIVLESGGNLSIKQYMVALVRFEENIFNTSNISNMSFDDVYDSAMNSKKFEFMSDDEKVKIIFSIVFGVIAESCCFMFFVSFIGRMFRRKKYKDNIEYRPLDLGTKIKKNELKYCRDIPCDGDLYYAYWVMIKYKILKEEECKNGLIGAILLKWIKEGYVELSKTKAGLFNFIGNKYAITFKNLNISQFQEKEDIEKYLMSIFRQASGDNDILEAKEFEKWCKENHSTMNRWFETLIDYITIKLQQKRLILEDRKEIRLLWKNKIIITKYVDNSVRNEALNLKGLKDYLLDYSLVFERENVEVHILEDYLVFAQLLGIAEKVEEQFSKLYPNFKQISKINLENTTIYTNALSTSMVSVLARETEKYQKRIERDARRQYSNSYSGNDRDSGGGGSSYSSGGSSAGGSSGGGCR